MDKFSFNLLGFHPSFLFSHFQVAVIQFHHYFAHKHMNAVALHNMRSTNSTNCGQLNKLFNGEKKKYSRNFISLFLCPFFKQEGTYVTCNPLHIIHLRGVWDSSNQITMHKSCSLSANLARHESCNYCLKC